MKEFENWKLWQKGIGMFIGSAVITVALITGLFALGEISNRYFRKKP